MGTSVYCSFFTHAAQSDPEISDGLLFVACASAVLPKVPVAYEITDHDRGYLEADLERTGRSGADLVFGRTPAAAFVSSTIDNRAKKAWAAFNNKEREAAAAADHEPDLLQPLTLHECRHTFASLLIDAGANPRAVQTFMGHSKIQTTFDIYGHLLPGSHDEVRERMDAYLTST